MPLVLADRVQETTNTTGTGTLTLAGAVSGFQSFAAIGNANTTYYAIVSDADWEVGVGTYTASSNTLSRDIVTASSNSGSLVNLTSQSVVFSTYAAALARNSVIGLNPPVYPAAGDLWWDSYNGSLKIYYTDGDSAQWVDAFTATSFAAPAGPAGPAGPPGPPGPTGPGGPYGIKTIVIADSNTINVTADITDLAIQNNTQSAGTLTVNAPTGTIVEGQKLMFRIKSTNVQTFSWNAIFQGTTLLPLPSSTTGSSKYDYFGFIYNADVSKWQLLSLISGF
jgi:hypothetical protein